MGVEVFVGGVDAVCNFEGDVRVGFVGEALGVLVREEGDAGEDGRP